MTTILAQTKEWAAKIIYSLVASFLALCSFRTPWRPKVAAVACAIAFGLAADAMTTNFALSLIVKMAGISAAYWILSTFLPPKLKTEFRARASSIEMQAKVQSYFECLVVVAILMIIVLLYLSWRDPAG